MGPDESHGTAPKPRMGSRIGYKLILTIGALAVSIMAALSLTITTSEQQALLTQVEHNANQVSEIVKSSTRYDMLMDRRESVHRIIESIGRSENIGKLRIFNKEGKIIFSSYEPEIGVLVDKRAEACTLCHAAERPLERLSIPDRTRIFKDRGVEYLGIINPIYSERSCQEAACHAHGPEQRVLGVLDVTMPLGEVSRQIRVARARMVLFTLGGIAAISLLLWILVHRLVNRPVRELVKATTSVAGGDFDYRVRLSTRDELGDLARAFNDMTQRLSETQQQLYQAEKLASLGRMAASVAHEINSPLTGVLGYSSSLLNHSVLDPQVKEDLEVIVRETKRCREIVRDLLEFARPAPPERSSIDVRQVLDRALKVVGPRLSGLPISVRIDIPADVSPIHADEGQVQQVFINLLANAADAIGGREGEIVVGARREMGPGGEDVRITVSDTGVGIPAEELDKLFEPFHSTKGRKGVGLGLAIVGGIVRRHGGSITVESAVGKGTTFILHLPVSERRTS